MHVCMSIKMSIITFTDCTAAVVLLVLIYVLQNSNEKEIIISTYFFCAYVDKGGFCFVHFIDRTQ